MWNNLPVDVPDYSALWTRRSGRPTSTLLHNTSTIVAAVTIRIVLCFNRMQVKRFSIHRRFTEWQYRNRMSFRLSTGISAAQWMTVNRKYTDKYIHYCFTFVPGRFTEIKLIWWLGYIQELTMDYHQRRIWRKTSLIYLLFG